MIVPKQGHKQKRKLSNSEATNLESCKEVNRSCSCPPADRYKLQSCCLFVKVLPPSLRIAHLGLHCYTLGLYLHFVGQTQSEQVFFTPSVML